MSSDVAAITAAIGAAAVGSTAIGAGAAQTQERLRRVVQAASETADRPTALMVLKLLVGSSESAGPPPVPTLSSVYLSSLRI
jgi:hypothetical protein